MSLHCRDNTFSTKLRFVVYKYGMQQRTDELAFNTMWRKYEAAASAKNTAEMKFILLVIGQTRNMSHVDKYVYSLDTCVTLRTKPTLKISHGAFTLDKLGLRFESRLSCRCQCPDTALRETDGGGGSLNAPSSNNYCLKKKQRSSNENETKIVYRPWNTYT